MNHRKSNLSIELKSDTSTEQMTDKNLPLIEVTPATPKPFEEPFIQNQALLGASFD
jgi:hypothetical protein